MPIGSGANKGAFPLAIKRSIVLEFGTVGHLLVTPLMLDGIYQSRNFATLGPIT